MACHACFIHIHEVEKHFELLSLLLHYNLQTVMKSLFLFRLLFYLFFYLEAYLANLQHVSMAQVQYGYVKKSYKLKFLGFKTKKCFFVCVCVWQQCYMH